MQERAATTTWRMTTRPVTITLVLLAFVLAACVCLNYVQAAQRLTLSGERSTQGQPLALSQSGAAR